jgi:predicted amidophosphoribosyltransferase
MDKSKKELNILLVDDIIKTAMVDMGFNFRVV